MYRFLFILCLLFGVTLLGWGAYQVYFYSPATDFEIPRNGVRPEKAVIGPETDAEPRMQSPSILPPRAESKYESAKKQAPEKAATGPLGYTSRYGELPKSLKHVDVPGSLQVDASGRLVINHDIRNVFDFFMAGISEEPRETVSLRIREYIAHALADQPGAAEQANAILDQYTAYKDFLSRQQSFRETMSIRNLSDSKEKVAAFKDLMRFRMDARRAHMSEDVVDAFFADEEAYDEYSIKMLELGQKTGLTAEEKENRIREIEECLPPQMRKRRRQERRIWQVEQRIQTLKAQGGHADHIYDLRKEIYGPDAAKRLAEGDRQNE